MTATPRCCSAPPSTWPMTRNFDGTAIVIFQPAEEGGAAPSDAEGGPDGALRHTGGLWPAQQAGPAARQLRDRPGAIMAAADRITIRVDGKGGPRGGPARVHRPVLVASHIVTALQSIASRTTTRCLSAVILDHAGQGRRRLQRDPGIRDPERHEVRTALESVRDTLRGAHRGRWPRTSPPPSAPPRPPITDRGYPVTANDPAKAMFMVRRRRGGLGRRCGRARGPADDGRGGFFVPSERTPRRYIFLGTGPGAGLHTRLRTSRRGRALTACRCSPG